MIIYNILGRQKWTNIFENCFMIGHFDKCMKEKKQFIIDENMI